MRDQINTPWLIISVGYALLSGVAYFVGFIGPFGPFEAGIVFLGLVIFIGGSFNPVLENWRYELSLALLFVLVGIVGILASGTADAFMAVFILLGCIKIGSIVLNRYTVNIADSG